MDAQHVACSPVGWSSTEHCSVCPFHVTHRRSCSVVVLKWGGLKATQVWRGNRGSADPQSPPWPGWPEGFLNEGTLQGKCQLMTSFLKMAQGPKTLSGNPKFQPTTRARATLSLLHPTVAAKKSRDALTQGQSLVAGWLPPE